LSDKSSPRKIDGQIRFPASINMMLYTTLAMNLKAKETEGESSAQVLA